ncbi:glutathione hydrolase 7-like isoform X2 [Belonocnema kinseyi]|uniref:glutathione hydrolase 7-like isoform X2 n=1 Tax=Belonocnema kinseyi TaxID=2817044 RepID=UPI00143D1983|nr:glutathione hydrolase 7-like isoform X2 [Belonocnema kinseyi]
MHFIIRQPPTEECPLTKERSDKCTDCRCSRSGFGIICCCFFILSIAITTALILQLSYGNSIPPGKTAHGAVATDYTNCSQIGTKILRKGGNAIDAAVAATVCMTVVAPHKTGIGGGGYIMIYSQIGPKTQLVVDFVNNTIEGQFGKANTRIPAVLKALELVQSLRGNLAWQEVIEPSVSLARTGFIASRELAYELSKHSDYEKKFHPVNGGEIYQRPILANTLELVGQHGADVLYNGSLSSEIVSKIGTDQKLLRDLASYEPQVIAAKETSLFDHTILYPPHANLVEFTLKELEKLHIQKENATTIESQIQVAEALVHANLISQHPIITRQKYAGVVAMDWQGTYVSIVTGLNSPLNVSLKTDAGFFLDTIDQRDGLINLTPVLFHDDVPNCGLSGSFNSDDPAVIGQILYNYLAVGFNLSTTIEYPRYYLLPDGVAIENDSSYSIDMAVLNQLKSSRPPSAVDPNSIMKSINMIIERRNKISSHSDSRGGGLSSRY